MKFKDIKTDGIYYVKWYGIDAIVHQAKVLYKENRRKIVAQHELLGMTVLRAKDFICQLSEDRGQI